MEIEVKNFGIYAAVLGFLGVILGAFGSHMFEDRLSPERFDTFQTAVRYQMYHALAMLVTIQFGFNMETKSNNIMRSLKAFSIGITIFSGSLYLLIITNFSYLGALAPIGGLFLIVGWFYLVLFFRNMKII